MPKMPRISLPEGGAEPQREGIRQGQWSGQLPGLAAELDVAPRMVRQALGLLEAEGLLGGRGLGRSRGITAARTNAIRPPLSVAILRHGVRLADNPQSALLLTEIMHSLEVAGFRRGNYSLPEWEASPAEFDRLLERLFRGPAG